ncbi:MAG: cytochrome c oxidase subunit II [Candidatus Omnitrophica bacterium]|nr:cytochrome c oxidase subunit II [Candidatus Omnitrophota bacterium]
MNTVDKVDSVFLFILTVSVILLVIITFLMVLFVIKYDRKKNLQPKNIESNTVLEIIWVLVPTILVLFMFYYGWTGFKSIRGVPKDAMVVKVTARMWSWLFEYENGKKSKALNVPVGRPVKLALLSQDVIHSFYLPAFRVKEDAVPRLKTYLWFKPEEVGSYDIFCAEYCGTGHSSMLSKLIVMPEDDFRKWYEGEAVSEERVEVEKMPHGLRLIEEEGCTVCHTTDGSLLVGPTFKGMFGRSEKVMANGAEREIIIDEEYISRSIKEPNADVAKGFESIMPEIELTEEQIKDIIEYLKTLK